MTLTDAYGNQLPDDDMHTQIPLSIDELHEEIADRANRPIRLQIAALSQQLKVEADATAVLLNEMLKALINVTDSTADIWSIITEWNEESPAESFTSALLDDGSDNVVEVDFPPFPNTELDNWSEPEHPTGVSE